MLNNISLQGRVAGDIELKSTPNGVSVCAFSIACERDFRDTATGQREVDFIDVVAWRNNAEFISGHFAKGDMIIINGRLQNRVYQDKDGNRRKTSEVIINDAYFGGKKDTSGIKTDAEKASEKKDDFMNTDFSGDEFIPFN